MKIFRKSLVQCIASQKNSQKCKCSIKSEAWFRWKVNRCATRVSLKLLLAKLSAKFLKYSKCLIENWKLNKAVLWKLFTALSETSPFSVVASVQPKKVKSKTLIYIFTNDSRTQTFPCHKLQSSPFTNPKMTLCNSIFALAVSLRELVAASPPSPQPRELRRKLEMQRRWVKQNPFHVVLCRALLPTFSEMLCRSGFCSNCWGAEKILIKKQHRRFFSPLSFASLSSEWSSGTRMTSATCELNCLGNGGVKTSREKCPECFFSTALWVAFSQHSIGYEILWDGH